MEMANVAHQSICENTAKLIEVQTKLKKRQLKGLKIQCNKPVQAVRILHVE